MKLTIGYFYHDLLNLYGDGGNVEILCSRASRRGFEVEVVPVSIEMSLSSEVMKPINLVFMGGGPDSGQMQVYEDLLLRKSSYLKEYIENGGVGLFICGSYQLFGHYYKASDGKILKGLGIFNLYTEHFGNNKPRCIGNVYCELSNTIMESPFFNAVKDLGPSLVGFENHGGRTYLGAETKPFAKVIKGYGNNGEDGTEGVIYKNSIGSYLHGPILARNPHLADYLLSQALNIKELPELDDTLIIAAHTASRSLKQ